MSERHRPHVIPSAQLSLFGSLLDVMPPPAPAAAQRQQQAIRLQQGPQFDGATYEPPRDQARLAYQLARVFAVMQDGGWHTLRALAASAEASEASVSARLRDLRKPRFGAHLVERQRVPGVPGLFEYRLRRRLPDGSLEPLPGDDGAVA